MVGTSGTAARALHRGDRETAQCAAEDLRRRRRQIGKTDQCLSGDHRLDHRRAAGIRHARLVKLESKLEQFRRELRRGAEAGIGDGIFAGIGLQERDQFLDGFRRQRRMIDQYIRRGAGQRYRRKILERVVRFVGVKARIDHIARARHQDRVAIRRGTRDLRHADIAAGARVVLDIERLPQRLR